MGVKVYDVYTGGTDWFLNNSVVKNVFSNPINTAIIIVMVMVLLVAFYYKDYDGEDRYGKLFRVGLYGGIFVLMAMFVHNTLINKALEKKAMDDDDKIIFGTALHPAERRVDIEPSKIGKAEHRNISLDDIPDIQARSSDSSESSDILAPRKSAVKMEDLV